MHSSSSNSNVERELTPAEKIYAEIRVGNSEFTEPPKSPRIRAGNSEVTDSSKLLRDHEFTQEQQEKLLYSACRHGYLFVLKQLFEKYGLDLLNKPLLGGQTTALEQAVLADQQEVIQYLFHIGITPVAINQQKPVEEAGSSSQQTVGLYPLYWTVEKGDIELATLLYSRQLTLGQVKDSDDQKPYLYVDTAGKTPVELALELKNFDMASLFLNFLPDEERCTTIEKLICGIQAEENSYPYVVGINYLEALFHWGHQQEIEELIAENISIFDTDTKILHALELTIKYEKFPLCYQLSQKLIPSLSDNPAETQNQILLKVALKLKNFSMAKRFFEALSKSEREAVLEQLTGWAQDSNHPYSYLLENYLEALIYINFPGQIVPLVKKGIICPESRINGLSPIELTIRHDQPSLFKVLHELFDFPLPENFEEKKIETREGVVTILEWLQRKVADHTSTILLEQLYILAIKKEQTKTIEWLNNFFTDNRRGINHQITAIFIAIFYSKNDFIIEQLKSPFILHAMGRNVEIFWKDICHYSDQKEIEEKGFLIMETNPNTHLPKFEPFSSMHSPTHFTITPFLFSVLCGNFPIVQHMVEKVPNLITPIDPEQLDAHGLPADNKRLYLAAAANERLDILDFLTQSLQQLKKPALEKAFIELASILVNYEYIRALEWSICKLVELEKIIVMRTVFETIAILAILQGKTQVLKWLLEQNVLFRLTPEQAKEIIEKRLQNDVAVFFIESLERDELDNFKWLVDTFNTSPTQEIIKEKFKEYLNRFIDKCIQKGDLENLKWLVAYFNEPLAVLFAGPANRIAEAQQELLLQTAKSDQLEILKFLIEECQFPLIFFLTLSLKTKPNESLNFTFLARCICEGQSPQIVKWLLEIKKQPFWGSDIKNIFVYCRDLIESEKTAKRGLTSFLKPQHPISKMPHPFDVMPEVFAELFFKILGNPLFPIEENLLMIHARMGDQAKIKFCAKYHELLEKNKQLNTAPLEQEYNKFSWPTAQIPEMGSQANSLPNGANHQGESSSSSSNPSFSFVASIGKRTKSEASAGASSSTSTPISSNGGEPSSLTPRQYP